MPCKACPEATNHPNDLAQARIGRDSQSGVIAPSSQEVVAKNSKTKWASCNTYFVTDPITSEFWAWALLHKQKKPIAGDTSLVACRTVSYQ